MADRTNTARLRITRKQGILLAGLGSVLLGVLFFGSEPDVGVAVPGQAVQTTGSSETAPRRMPGSPATAVGTRQLPKVSLDQMLRQNPFSELIAKEEAHNTDAVRPAMPLPHEEVESEAARTDEIAAEKRRKMEEALAAFQNQKVKLIMRSETQATALVGDRLVREGDIVDGVRIVSIRANGVVVEPTTID